MKIRFNNELVNTSYRFLDDQLPQETILYGGSSSGKTFSLSQFIPIWALEGRSILIVRQVANTLRKSVWSDITKIIAMYGLSDLFDITVSTMQIVSKHSNGCIMFGGLDDVEKVKGITPAKAMAFDTLWVEEATETREEDYNQLILRMRGQTEFKKRRIITFNPIYKLHWIYQRWFADKTAQEQISFNSPDLIIKRTTYHDNAYLGEDEIQALEDMQWRSPYH